MSWKEKEEEKKKRGIDFKELKVLLGFVLLEVIILFVLSIFTFSPYLDLVLAVVGQDNVTVSATLGIGNSFPEVVNITINENNNIDLTPNATTEVSVVAIIRDYNGEGDFNVVNSEFFDNTASFYGDSDDNNMHYSNSSCSIDVTYGGSTEANATCIFSLEYYSNNASWNATVFVNDSLSSFSIGSEVSVVNSLLALGLPDSINYGEVNATAVSDQKEANVTNFGNVLMNLSLSGYGATIGDGNAMNCTLGSIKNVSIENEKYNLTSSIAGNLNLTQFDINYTNLSSTVVVNEFNLPQRLNDANPYLDDTNTTYWRIYLPLGVAGSCSGNIVFGATQSTAG